MACRLLVALVVCLLIEILGASFSPEVKGLGNVEVRAPEELRNRQCRWHETCDANEFCRSVYFQCRPCDECEFDGDSITSSCPSYCPDTPKNKAVDEHPPVLNWLTVDPTYVDVSQGDERVYVTVYFDVSDDVSGFEWAEITFASMSHSQALQTYTYREGQVVTGDANNGVVRAMFWFVPYDEGGHWSMYALVLRDRAANYRRYTKQDFVMMGDNINSTIAVRAQYYVTCGTAYSLECDEDHGLCTDVPVRSMEMMSSPSDPIAARCVCQGGKEGDGIYCIDPIEVAVTNSSGQDYVTDNSGGWGIYNPQTGSEVYGNEWHGDNVPEPATGSAPPPPAGETVANSPSPWDVQSRWEHEADNSEGHVSGVRHLVASILALFMAGLVLQIVRRNRSLLRVIMLRQRMHQHHNAQIHPISHRSPGLAWVNGNTAAGPRGHGLSAQAREIRMVLGHGSSNPRLPNQFLEEEGFVFGRHVVHPMPGRPRSPEKAALPAHLLPGAVPSKEEDEIAEGEECAICMIRRKSAVLLPCKHRELCQGCAGTV
eukprot:CAMPEP_0184299078 /NCGR_PEP_ID=MMETSP1049-20130417/9754_1 /TAXON_ID=77928 /ORGANISM="Proteomonas sulcata, Strain CCMP704" /LENGTH=541 /DNA_ID=CAMNT_0026609409 /DNA_START=27 /DNA_END=1652 /DNA_ORIENTATION=-